MTAGFQLAPLALDDVKRWRLISFELRMKVCGEQCLTSEIMRPLSCSHHVFFVAFHET